MNTYKIISLDVGEKPRISCGMNNIKYLGDNFHKAVKVFNSMASSPRTVVFAKYSNTKYAYEILSHNYEEEEASS